MTPDDAPQFARLLGGLGEVFNEPMSEIRARLYFEALKDLPLASIEAAVSRLIQGARFFPKPAEIRETLEGSVEDRARESWRRLLGALEHVGTYESVDFGDPILHAVVESLGGWHQAWAWERVDGPELLGIERDFVSLYRLYSQRRPSRAASPVLLGQHSLRNRQLGAAVRGEIPAEVVVRVGSVGQALERRAVAASEPQKQLAGVPVERA
jgi:hypothetical protein